jgi:hypothetical protein
MPPAAIGGAGHAPYFRNAGGTPVRAAEEDHRATWRYDESFCGKTDVCNVDSNLRVATAKSGIP